MALLARDDQSLWFKAHARQALVLGVLVTIVLLAVLALPLVVVVGLGGPDSGATIQIYTVALVLDTLAFVLAIALCVSAAGRASRGLTFRLPLVAPIADRIFTRRHP